MNCSCKPHCLPCVPPLTQARLKGHPNVLRLHAVAFAGPRGGETDGFFLLDFCPGNLLDLLARHNYLLEQATALHIFGCVARAVAHMHAQSPPMAHRWGEGRRPTGEGRHSLQQRTLATCGAAGLASSWNAPDAREAHS